MNEEQFRALSKQIKREVVPDIDVINHRNKINLLENKLKNIVVRQIVHIREERNKQNIVQAVQAIIREKKEEKERRSKKVEKFVKRKFEEVAANDMALHLQNDDERVSLDILYYRVIVKMNRLLKVLTGHSNAIDSLEKKLKEISEPLRPRKQNQGLRLVDDDMSYQPGEVGVPRDNILQHDDEGLEGFVEHDIRQNNQDELDVESEGQNDREMMMDQIKMVSIDEMPMYKDYNVRIDENNKLNISESGDLEDVSSEDSDDSAEDKDVE